ncbi:UNVERIFIED_CONTAM: hypothetical protein Slati_4198000 [Sesamum latifolium]|uniref:Uncharacterized protein n=1 Tax=Sesamum latifolium TaxID=2727402 RepID=A0AAW2TDA1_9LAMI
MKERGRPQDAETSGRPNFSHGWSCAASCICTRSSLRDPRRGQQGSPRLCAISDDFRRIFYRSSRSMGPSRAATVAVGPIHPGSALEH